MAKPKKQPTNSALFRKKWAEITQNITPRNQFEIELLTQWCNLSIRAEQANTQIQRDGLLITASNGMLGQHPSIKTAKECAALMLRIYERLKPSIRANEGEEDELL